MEYEHQIKSKKIFNLILAITVEICVKIDPCLIKKQHLTPVALASTISTSRMSGPQIIISTVFTQGRAVNVIGPVIILLQSSCHHQLDWKGINYRNILFQMLSLMEVTENANHQLHPSVNQTFENCISPPDDCQTFNVTLMICALSDVLVLRF